MKKKVEIEKLENDLKFKIALSLVPKVGNQLAKKLVAFCGTPEAVFREKKAILEKIPNIGKTIASNIFSFKNFKIAEKEVEYTFKNDIKTLFYTDDDYPFRLKECYDAPIVLYSKGKINYNQQRVVSIVGTRNPTKYGRDMTEKLLHDIADCDVLVVSGMAYGIDITAHKMAVQNDLSTIGVIAHGHSAMYPAAHRNFADKIISKGQGNILSEYMSDILPERENFPTRNRIVAGLSDATIVIESKLSGGSLITAEIANAYARDVFAFPGKSTDEFSAGSNKLIKTNKAALIDSADDIKYLMRWLQEDTKLSKQQLQAKIDFPLDLKDEEKVILQLLQKNKDLHIEHFITAMQLNSSDLAFLLLELEMKSLVKALPGKKYALQLK
jgi:DNA processing protein